MADLIRHLSAMTRKTLERRMEPSSVFHSMICHLLTIFSVSTSRRMEPRSTYRYVFSSNLIAQREPRDRPHTSISQRRAEWRGNGRRYPGGARRWFCPCFPDALQFRWRRGVQHQKRYRRGYLLPWRLPCLRRMRLRS